MINEVAIGIDLGTTYSCAAVLKQNEVVIIPNDFGYRTTPSYVAFTPNDRLVGNAAKYQLSKNAKNTVYDVKRLIGCDFRDGLVQQYAIAHHWPFHVKPSADFKPLIEVEFRGQKREFRAEEISAMILAKLRDIAQVYLGVTVRSAVVTVPAHFSDGQRQATKAAADIAGLHVLRIVNEPTAAAIAYGLERKDRTAKRTILVFDLGGGTCDVSILGVKGGNFTVIAQAGFADFGGESFDNRLVDYCAKDFQAKHQVDLTQPGYERPLHRLRIACETAKRHLSVATETSVDIDALHNSIDYSLSINRALFEELNRDSFGRCRDILQAILTDHDIALESLDDVVLVGGSTRIPMVQKIITDFVGKPACRTINPDEAVAYGAALLAASLSDSKNEKVAGLCFQEVTPLSLGIETAGGVFDKILDKGSPYPTQKTVLFSTYKDNQSYVRIKVFQGEHYLTRDNRLLGQFTLEGIPLASRGVPQIMVVFDIDANGILSVTAQDRGSGHLKKIIVVSELGRLSQQEIAQMKVDAESYRAEDQAHNARIKAENRLEEYCYAMRHKLRDQENVVLPSGLNKAAAENKITNVLQWLKSSRKTTDDKEDLEAKRRELEKALMQRPLQVPIVPDVCGIDLGTMNSRVAAITKDGSTRLLPNEFENSCTASYVAFVDTMCLVGDLARRQHAFNTANTICGVKQMIGRSYEYVGLNHPIATLPFTLKRSLDGRPLIEVISNDLVHHMVPEDILTMLLAKMRETAESNLAVPAIRAVIAVPPYYEEFQRRAVEKAAATAGIVPLKTVDEPVAAAVAYELDRSVQVKGELIILVFDMGSGTCDVSLLSLSTAGEFFLLATHCAENNLCGDAFDGNLVDYCCDVFESENNINVRHDGKALRRLQSACERAKRTLSTEMLVEIDVEALQDNVDCSVTITRAGFEDINCHVFEACVEAVETVLQESAFERNAVDEVLLIGGCARIPKLRRMLTEFFAGKEPRKGIEPSEAIARGAAILASRQQFVHESDT